MQIAIFGRSFHEGRSNVIKELYCSLHENGVEFLVIEPFYHSTASLFPENSIVRTFNKSEELTSKTSCLMTIGGDGTLLEALTYIRNSDIPVLGIKPRLKPNFTGSAHRSNSLRVAESACAG